MPPSSLQVNGTFLQDTCLTYIVLNFRCESTSKTGTNPRLNGHLIALENVRFMGALRYQIARLCPKRVQRVRENARAHCVPLHTNTTPHLQLLMPAIKHTLSREFLRIHTLWKSVALNTVSGSKLMNHILQVLLTVQMKLCLVKNPQIKSTFIPATKVQFV